MTNQNFRPRFNLGQVLSVVYFLTWISLVTEYSWKLNLDQALEIFMNALIIALFVGLGLNVNAFQIRTRDGDYRSLKKRVRYILDHRGKVFGFFLVPFCVSSISSLVVVAKDASLVEAVFGGVGYVLIMLGGFLIFIFLPAMYILYRHGWDRPAPTRSSDDLAGTR